MLAAREKAAMGRRPGRAAVFALSGGLGAGKTTFVKGFLAGLGARGRAASPTFVIVRRHPLRVSSGRRATRPRTQNAYHIDAYRLKTPGDLAALGFDRILAGGGAVLIEWAEKVKKLLPKGAVWVSFKHGEKENERRISVRGGGMRVGGAPRAAATQVRKKTGARTR